MRELLHVFERHGVSLASIHSSRTPSGEVHFRIGFDDGADLVDVGGESTRPGSEPVGADEEIRRVEPVIAALAAMHGMVPPHPGPVAAADALGGNIGIGLLIGPRFIGWLRVRQGKGQPIRADGPQTHFKKAGTPTMGGLMMLFGIIGATLLWGNLTNPYVWVVVAVTLGFGAIGFYDDYLKVTKQTDKGFSGRARLAIEFVIAGLAAYVIMRAGATPFSSSLAFPFFKDFLINLGIFFIPFAAFVMVSAGNAVNLTDGLDGLAIVPIMIAASSFGVIAYLSGNAIFADYLQIHFVPGTGELAVVLGAVIGAGLGFL